MVAMVLVRDVYQRTFNWSNETNRQYVATEPSSSYHDPNSRVDGLLHQVDLGLVRATTWGLRNLGRILSIAFEHAVHWVVRILP